MPHETFSQVNLGYPTKINDYHMARKWRYHQQLQRNVTLANSRVQSPPKNLIASRMTRIDDIKRHNIGWKPMD
jgi:hypothetical protein